jgi:hypothetical protein
VPPDVTGVLRTAQLACDVDPQGRPGVSGGSGHAEGIRSRVPGAHVSLPDQLR